jgi:hypothetical protein
LARNKENTLGRVLSIFRRKKIRHHIHEPIFVGRITYFPDEGRINIVGNDRAARIKTMKDLKQFITKVMIRYDLRD